LALATSMAGRARCRMARSDLRLLVVDDDPDMRCLLGEILRPLGAVVAVPDVYQALNAVRYEPVDAIVLDLVFPGASGFDLMERLRTLQMPTPVVVVTGLTSDVALRRARVLVRTRSSRSLSPWTCSSARSRARPTRAVPHRWLTGVRSVESASVRVPGPSDSGPTRTTSGPSVLCVRCPAAEYEREPRRWR
jgi:CheY-like chemotaxis protein